MWLHSKLETGGIAGKAAVSKELEKENDLIGLQRLELLLRFSQERN
jgi:hypothetical protein